MSIVKQDHFMTFERLHRGSPFGAVLTLYTKTDGKEDEKEHLFYKLNSHKAVTLDKRITIHVLPHTIIRLCTVKHNFA
jgi:hypothetical protein